MTPRCTEAWRIASLAIALLVAGGCTAESAGGIDAGGAVAVVPDCQSDRDDQIDRFEVPTKPGITARFARNDLGEMVELAMGADDDGRDFGDAATDIGATMRLVEPAELGLDEAFPQARFAQGASVAHPDLYGMYRVEPAEDESYGELMLLGYATGPGTPKSSATLLRYDTPVVVERWPMQLGDTWGGEHTFRDALLGGALQAGVEDYFFEVDAAGSVLLPGGIEMKSTLRVRSTVVRTLALTRDVHDSATTTLRWLQACYGEVARSTTDGTEIGDTVEELRVFYP